MALEDKTRVDALWDSAGVARAPSRIVPVEGEALSRAHEHLDQGLGTVWVADNREGWHGGAQFLRWVRTAADMEEARAFLGRWADRVRVMPFLEGVPCSIHGLVFPETVVTFRPCEMMVFRVPGETRLSYAAASTFWRPDAARTSAMRDVARCVGAHLRETVAYRGAFTVDGVMTREGFRPTELNPRYGAALARLAAGEPDLPLYLLHLALVEGAELDYRPSDLESLVLEASQRRPTGRSHRVLTGEPREPRVAGLVREAAGFRFAADEETPEVAVQLGASAAGSFLVLDVRPEAVAMGPPLGPYVVEAFAFLDAAWDLGIGPLEAAADV